MTNTRESRPCFAIVNIFHTLHLNTRKKAGSLERANLDVGINFYDALFRRQVQRRLGMICVYKMFPEDDRSANYLQIKKPL